MIILIGFLFTLSISLISCSKDSVQLNGQNKQINFLREAHKDKANTLSLLTSAEFDEYVKNMVFTENAVLIGNASDILYKKLNSNEIESAWSLIYDNSINTELKKEFPVNKICTNATLNAKAPKSVQKEKYPKKMPEGCWDCLWGGGECKE